MTTYTYNCKWCTFGSSEIKFVQGHVEEDHQGMPEATALIEMAEAYEEKAAILRRAAEKLGLWQ